ncbi:MAG: hypothetical protein Q7R48_00400 [bacterium]|nr:hypothetical protein [bacterium]
MRSRRAVLRLILQGILVSFFWRAERAEAASISVAEATERALGKAGVRYTPNASGRYIVGLGGIQTQPGRSGLLYTVNTSSRLPAVSARDFPVARGDRIQWWLVASVNQGRPRAIYSFQVA